MQLVFSYMFSCLHTLDKWHLFLILCEDVVKILKKLTPREEAIIKFRYGFDLPEQTLEQVGKRYNITRERVRQIESKALKKLRKLEVSKKLKDYW